MVIEKGTDRTHEGALEGWEFPAVFDESTKAIVKLTGNDYDMDLTFEEGSDDILTAHEEDAPDDLGEKMTFERESLTSCRIHVGGVAVHEYTFTLLSFEHNGHLIYP